MLESGPAQSGLCVCGLEQAGRHASRIEMMQDGNNSRSKCGVMLALGGCCASDRLCAALRCAGDESSVGRSVDSLFWRAGVIRLFFPPRPFPLRGRRSIRGKNKSACVSWLHRGLLMSGSGSAGTMPIAD